MQRPELSKCVTSFQAEIDTGWLVLAGVALKIDPLGALIHEDERILIVADLHLEKGSSYAKRGVMLPPYDTATTLARLAVLIARWSPHRVIALGDSFHDNSGPERMAETDHASLAALQAYSWPGNVRQLRNVIDWLLIMAPGDTAEPVHADMLPNEITAIAPSVVKWDKASEIMTLPLREAREVFEREYLLAQVTRFGGNISRTASFVGMERSALHRKLKSLGVFGNERALRVGT